MGVPFILDLIILESYYVNSALDAASYVAVFSFYAKILSMIALTLLGKNLNG